MYEVLILIGSLLLATTTYRVGVQKGKSDMYQALILHRIINHLHDQVKDEIEDDNQLDHESLY